MLHPEQNRKWRRKRVRQPDLKVEQKLKPSLHVKVMRGLQKNLQRQLNLHRVLLQVRKIKRQQNVERLRVRVGVDAFLVILHSPLFPHSSVIPA
jgi:hypothetical protein